MQEPWQSVCNLKLQLLENTEAPGACYSIWESYQRHHVGGLCGGGIGTRVCIYSCAEKCEHGLMDSRIQTDSLSTLWSFLPHTMCYAGASTKLIFISFATLTCSNSSCVSVLLGSLLCWLPEIVQGECFPPRGVPKS